MQSSPTPNLQSLEARSVASINDAMPPQRTRNIADDSRSEVSSTREKYTSLLSTAAPSKGRRNGAGNAGFTSGLKEVTNANQPFNAQQDVPEDDKRVCIPHEQV